MGGIGFFSDEGTFDAVGVAQSFPRLETLRVLLKEVLLKEECRVQKANPALPHSHREAQEAAFLREAPQSLKSKTLRYQIRDR